MEKLPKKGGGNKSISLSYNQKVGELLLGKEGKCTVKLYLKALWRTAKFHSTQREQQ